MKSDNHRPLSIHLILTLALLQTVLHVTVCRGYKTPVKVFYEYCTLDKSIKYLKLIRNSNKYQSLIPRTDVDHLIQNNIRQNWNNYQLEVYNENTSLLSLPCGQHFQNIYLRSTLKINPRWGHKLGLNNAKYSTLMARSKDNFLQKHATHMYIRNRISSYISCFQIYQFHFSKHLKKPESTQR